MGPWTHDTKRSLARLDNNTGYWQLKLALRRDMLRFYGNWRVVITETSIEILTLVKF